MRRPQFRLKTLLGLLTAVCFALGAWHLHRYRQFVEVGPVRQYREIRARGRYFIHDGPVIQTFFALADIPGVEEFRDRDCCEGGVTARRTGAGAYDFDFHLNGYPLKPGIHRLRVWAHLSGKFGEPLETTFTVEP